MTGQRIVRAWAVGVVTLVVLVLAGVTAAADRAAAGTQRPGAGARRAAAPPRPMLAYAAGNRVVVVDRHGKVLTRVRRGFGGFSVDGGLLAKAYRTSSRTRTVGFDARSGERLFGIGDTLLIPTALRRGRAVAFLGQGDRDPYATSLWMRNGAGRERKLIQFAFGTSTHGVRTGISEGMVLDYSFDRSARTVAVVAGNDYADFRYDIWVVDVADRTHHRLTKGQHSRFPATSPDGSRVAFFREETVCGGPMPGYRAGNLSVVDADGTDRQLVYDGDCTRYLDRPRWLDDETLVTVSHTRRPGPDPDPLYDSQVVLVDAATGQVSDPISVTDRAGELSVSPGLSRIAYADWTKPKGFWVFHWKPGAGAPADPAAWIQGSTRRFDVGRVPHLRGDPTLIPSY